MKKDKTESTMKMVWIGVYVLALLTHLSSIKNVFDFFLFFLIIPAGIWSFITFESAWQREWKRGDNPGYDQLDTLYRIGFVVLYLLLFGIRASSLSTLIYSLVINPAMIWGYVSAAQAWIREKARERKGHLD